MNPNIQKLVTCQTVLVLIGGHAQRLLPFIKAIYPFVSYVLAIDSPKELRRLRNAAFQPRVRLFSLAQGHTAATLCRNLPPSVVRHIKSLGGMVASDGMGQSIALGREAGKELVASRDFQQFVKHELIPTIRDHAGGALEEVRFLYLGSIAGGTYSGAELPIADGLSKLTRKWSTAIVRTEFLVTGSLTYETLGERIWNNGGAALVDLLAYVTDPERDARDVRSLRLIELKQCGKDEALRDAFLAQLEQASHAKWTEYELERAKPNHALNSQFGNVQIWGAALGKPLELIADIAPAIADVYLRPLQDALERQPSGKLVQNIELKHTRTRLGNRSVEDILTTALDLPAEDSLSELCRPTYRHTVEAWALLAGSNRLRLADAPQSWSRSARTLAEIDERLQLQRRVLELLAEESQTLAARRETLIDQQQRAEQEYSRLHRLLKPKGIWAQVCSALGSTSARLKQWTTAAHEVRSAVDELEEVAAEQLAVDRITKLIDAEHTYLEERLRRIVERLHLLPKLGDQLPAVVPFPLDEQIESLWDAADKTDAEFAIVVRGCVQFASLAGLAQITGATAPRAEEIAKQIASSAAYVIPAVPWGGLLRADAGQEMHLLPPVDLEIQKCILEAAQAANPKLTVAFADSAAAIVNVVCITIRLVDCVEEVLTEPYQQALLEVLHSRCPEMFLLDYSATLKSLGIELDGNRLIFPKTA